jgi:hypothetical protein
MMLAYRVLSFLLFAFLLLQVEAQPPGGPGGGQGGPQTTEAPDVPVAPFDIQYLLNGVTAWSIVTGGVPNPSYTRKLALASKIPIPFELNKLDISVDAKGDAIEILSISNTFKDLDSTGAECMVTFILLLFFS